MKLISIILFSFLIVCTSCREDDFDILPPITYQGLNTFGCIVDWQLLTPNDSKSSLSGNGANGLSFHYRRDSLVNSLEPPYIDITAVSYGSSKNLIYLYIPAVKQEGVHEVNWSNGQTGIYSPQHAHVLANVYSSNKENPRYLSYENSGSIHIIRFDASKSIISGTFSLKLVDEETGKDTIEVKDGRFDINWRTLNCGKPREQPCPE